MNNIKIFVSHRIDLNSEIISNDVFVPVYCGATFLDSDNRNIFGDNTGDNISSKRNSFCELTVQYWAWKNVDCDYYGIAHYRRYFSFSDYDFDEDIYTNVISEKLDDSNRVKFCLDDIDKIKQIIAENDIIVTRPFNVTVAGYKNIREQYSDQEYLDVKDLNLLMDTIKNNHKGYYQIAKETFESEIFYPCNMFIMKKDIFNEYCEWLFDILFKLDPKLDMTNVDVNRRRAIGHIGERLLTVFINHKKQKFNVNLKILQRVYFKNTDEIAKLVINPISKDYLPLVFSSSEYFIPYLYVALKSIIESSLEETSLDIVILNTELTEKHKQTICMLQNIKKNLSIRFVNVKSFMEHYDYKANAHISVETFYRLFIPELFKKYSKVIYMDGDVIVKSDLSELYNMSSDEYVISGVRDLDFASQYYYNSAIEKYANETLGINDPSKYFQAGVIVLNIKRFHEKYDFHELLSFPLEYDYKYLDQDVLNKIFKNDIQYLPLEWNVLMDSYSNRVNNIKMYLSIDDVNEYLKSRDNAKIIHYAGGEKPWFNPECDFAMDYWNVARSSLVYEILLYRMAYHKSKEVGLYLENKNKLKFVKLIIRYILPDDPNLRRKMKNKLLSCFFSVFEKNGMVANYLRHIYHMVR